MPAARRPSSMPTMPTQPSSSSGSDYIPSPIELEWTARRTIKSNCELVNKQQRHINTTRWLRLTRSAMASEYHAKWCLVTDSCKHVVEHRPISDPDGVLSQMPLPAPSFMRQDACFSRYIEPLTGALRHPFAHGVCKLGVTWREREKLWLPVSDLNFSYLALPGAHCRPECQEARRSEGRRNLFFDLGCSFYSDRNLGLVFKLANRAAK